MSVTFRDESNGPSSTMIGYSDATVTMPNHPLIARSKASLDSFRGLHRGCGGGFVIRLYLILVISGQSRVKIFSPHNQTRPVIDLPFEAP